MDQYVSVSSYYNIDHMDVKHESRIYWGHRKYCLLQMSAVPVDKAFMLQVGCHYEQDIVSEHECRFGGAHS
jgi:hypothetical protein